MDRRADDEGREVRKVNSTRLSARPIAHKMDSYAVVSPLSSLRPLASSPRFVQIGGEGFLGSTIVRMLKERYPKAAVASLDVVQRQPVSGHTFETVDITNLETLTAAFKRSGATCVFHTASPHIGAPVAVHEKVNVDGTRTVIEACQAVGVRKLVFTSSAGVTFDGSDNQNIDERFEPFEVYPDAYMKTKVRRCSGALSC